MIDHARIGRNPPRILVVGLFGLSLAELILGGGGRWYDWGFLTPRMALFVACQLTWLICWIGGRFQPGLRILALTLIPLMGAFLAGIIGYRNGASISGLFTDIKPLLFWLNLPFYALVLRDARCWSLTSNLFRHLGLTMAIVYLAFWALWQSKFVDGWAFYCRTEDLGEFFFRGNMGFFYKGFVFLPAALFFWEKAPTPWKRLAQIIIYAAILLTFTRAIWLILLIFPLRVLWRARGKHSIAWVALLLMLLGPVLVEWVVVRPRTERSFAGLTEPYPNHEYLEHYPYPDWQRSVAFAFGQGIQNRHYSMMDRFVQFDEVMQRMTPVSLFIGHGFGNGTPLKPVHMEISYLEILHKQGLVGLGIWALLFLAVWVQWRRSSNLCPPNRKFAESLLESIFLMAALSFFNPFINSPMGLALMGLGIARPHRVRRLLTNRNNTFVVDIPGNQRIETIEQLKSNHPEYYGSDLMKQDAGRAGGMTEPETHLTGSANRGTALPKNETIHQECASNPEVIASGPEIFASNPQVCASNPEIITSFPQKNASNPEDFASESMESAEKSHVSGVAATLSTDFESSADPSLRESSTRPSVSVCMATYMGARWLPEQLESIITQLHEGDEICVADDGSTDDTVSILQAYIQRGYPIRFIPADRQPEHHPSYNLERALLRAKGDCIFLADQDDVWLRGKVDRLCQALRHHTLVVHDARVTDETLKTTNPSFFTLHRTKYGAIENFIRNGYLGCCMAFRRSLLEKALPFPKQLAMHDIWLGNVAALRFDTCFLPEIWVLYRRHRDTASSTASQSRNTLLQQFSLRRRLALQLWRNLSQKP